jgi:esterase/lipase
LRIPGRSDHHKAASAASVARRAPRWRRWTFRFTAVSGLLVVVFLLGPRPRVEERWAAPNLPEELDAYLDVHEASVPALRVGDEKGIVRHVPGSRDTTELALVYLHGFSADRHEVEPLITRVASEVGANVFFTRLTGHGRNGAAMADAKVVDWFDDAAEAFTIGAALGRRVVLVGTSTGGTLATWAATRPEVEGRLAALVLISPNFHPRDHSARILLAPWGGLIARLTAGDSRCFEPASEEQERHWTTCYPISALEPMMALVEHVRRMDLSAIDVPVLVVYSPQDEVVDPLETERSIQSMTSARVEVWRYEGAEDPSQHLLAGDILSPGSTGALANRIERFLASIEGDG